MRRSPASEAAFDAIVERQRAQGEVIYEVPCDGGCGAVFVGTHVERRRARWIERWRKTPGSGVETQVDLCPACRRRNDSRG